MSKWVHCLKCCDYALIEAEVPEPSPEVLPDLSGTVGNTRPATSAVCPAVLPRKQRTDS